jgi:hypothetical protein
MQEFGTVFTGDKAGVNGLLGGLFALLHFSRNARAI